MKHCSIRDINERINDFNGIDHLDMDNTFYFDEPYGDEYIVCTSKQIENPKGCHVKHHLKYYGLSREELANVYKIKDIFNIHINKAVDYIKHWSECCEKLNASLEDYQEEIFDCYYLYMYNKFKIDFISAELFLNLTYLGKNDLMITPDLLIHIIEDCLKRYHKYPTVVKSTLIFIGKQVCAKKQQGTYPTYRLEKLIRELE